MQDNELNLVVVLGPTASGKTRFAARLAHAIQGEIISADSRQVYRQMDLGTGKDYADYQLDGHTVASHLIDICDPGDNSNRTSMRSLPRSISVNACPSCVAARVCILSP